MGQVILEGSTKHWGEQSETKYTEDKYDDHEDDHRHNRDRQGPQPTALIVVLDQEQNNNELNQRPEKTTDNRTYHRVSYVAENHYDDRVGELRPRGPDENPTSYPENRCGDNDSYYDVDQDRHKIKCQSLTP